MTRKQRGYKSRDAIEVAAAVRAALEESLPDIKWSVRVKRETLPKDPMPGRKADAWVEIVGRVRTGNFSKLKDITPV